MKLAFLISAHTDAPQLTRLIKALPNDSLFYIHIDQKAELSVFEQALKGDDRVRFLSHRVNVVWGSINEVEYQMELIRAALGEGTPFDYLITLSGMDYPLWSKERITAFFQDANGQEYLCGTDITWQDKPSRLYRQYRLLAERPWKNGSLKSKFRVALRHLLVASGVRKPLVFKAGDKEYHLYKGAAWWAITPQLASFVLKEWDENESLVKYFRTSFCPAETFIQTVVFNSEWKAKCLEQTTAWESLEALTPLTYIYYHPVIKTLTEEDYDTIMSSNKMFARKLQSGVSEGLIAMIDKQLYPNTQTP